VENSRINFICYWNNRIKKNSSSVFELAFVMYSRVEMKNKRKKSEERRKENNFSKICAKKVRSKMD